MKIKTNLLATALAITSIFTAANAYAEKVLEEVVVTVQKREQGLQDVPVSVSAYSGEMVEEAGVKDVRDLAGLTPGLSIKSRGETEGSIFIRGIGSAAPGIGADPAVGVYIDGLYAARGTNATAAFFDVERVEVVKGPQGTLFGRNSSAGAISIITRKPDLEENSGSVLLGLGDEGQVKLEAIGNFVVNDKTAVRLGVKHDERDGLYFNPVTGKELNDRDHTNVRGSILFEDDAFQSHFSVEIIDMSNNAAFVSGAQAFDAEVPLDDVPSDQFLESTRANWTNTWDLNNGMTLTSITGYYTHDVNVTPVDADLIDFFVASFQEPQNADFFSQEIRLNGSTDKMDWFVGASYSKEELDFVNDLRYDEAVVADLFGLNGLDADNGNACDSVADFDLDGDGVGDTGLITGLPTCPVTSETPSGDNTTDSWAIYTDITWHLTDTVDVTVGARYTEDTKDMRYNNPPTNGLLGVLDFQIFGPITPGQLRAEDDWSSFDPRLAVNWDVTDNTSLYVNIAKGYKSGGLNRQLDPVSGGILPFDKETNLAYEAGLKTRFWEGRGLLNAAIFSNNYEDFQLEEQLNLVPQVNNVGDVDVTGLDLDFRLLLTDEFELWGSLGLLDTEVDDNGGPRNGNATPQAPETSASLAAKYTVPLAGGELQTSLTWQYSDDFFFDLANTLSQDSYDVWNARIAWEKDTWGVALVGENIGDEEYLSEQFGFLDPETSIRAAGSYFRVEAYFDF